MTYTELKLQFAQSVCLRLLRADNVALALAFLHSAFKREHTPGASESRLRAMLDAELEELRDAGDAVAAKSAREYLLEWADPAHGYLRRYQPDGEEEPVYELTPELERVFQWLESLKPRSHVGTESKFKSLAVTLAEIVQNSTREPDVRVQGLRAEQARLQKQIDEIERTGVVPVFSATQINERFGAVLDTARQLLGDFREVERHFRRVTGAIIVQQAQACATRGAIVGQTLDAQEQLRLSSQGQSFYAFWDFLLTPEWRREFCSLVEQAYALPELADELRLEPLLRRLPANLRAEGNKVVASNERLVGQLRRVLDTRESLERREVGRLLQEIKALSHRTRELPSQCELVEVDTGPELVSLMSKLPWSPPTSVDFGGGLELNNGGDYREALEAFLRLHPVDFERLRQNIRECLRTRVQITLPEVLGLCPPRNGILEVLAYLFIAESDGPHVVLDAFDVLELPGDEARRFRVPQVVFSNT